MDLDKLRGSIPPLITPFQDNGGVDYDVYAGLVTHQIEQGSHGILVNGTTSEPSTLTIAERKKILEVAVDTAKGRLPIVAATGSQSYAESLELTEHAAQVGADALLIVTPYYIRPPQRGLVEYYADLGGRTDLPLMIYHIPGRTAVSMQIDTLKSIRERTPTLIGIKHAVNDLGFVSTMLSVLGQDFRVFVGLEDLSFPMLCVGASGLMNAVSNLAPRQVASLYEKVRDGDLKGARKIHYEIFELNQAVFYDTNPIPIKYMMKRMGLIPAENHRLPMVPSKPELARRLDRVLENSGLI